MSVLILNVWSGRRKPDNWNTLKFIHNHTYTMVLWSTTRKIDLTRLWSVNPTHDSILGYGSIMNFPSSLGALLCKPRPDIDTLLCMPPMLWLYIDHQNSGKQQFYVDFLRKFNHCDRRDVVANGSLSPLGFAFSTNQTIIMFFMSTDGIDWESA